MSVHRFAYGFPVFLLVLGVFEIAGCTSTSTVVYPSSEQSEDVRRVTQRGFDFLHSDKTNSRVTVSLRSATSSYASLYVSIANRADGGSLVVPSSFTVTAKNKDQSEETYSVYAPEEVPGVLASEARAQSSVITVMSYYANLNGQIQAGRGGQTIYARSAKRDEGSSGTGAYGAPTSDEDRNLELQELLLQKQVIGPGNVTDGLVYSPFTETATGMDVSVTIGAETHTFKYDIVKEK